MLIRLMLALVMVGCATTQPQKPTPSAPEEKKKIPPLYKVGDCLMLVDPSNGKKPTRHRVRVEKISLQEGRYYYRWLLDNGRWDSGLSATVGKFEVLEKITQKVNDCP